MKIMKKPQIIIIFVIIAVLLALAFYYYNNSNNYTKDYFSNNSNYKWITSGTCKSNHMQDLSMGDCSGYFDSSNYDVVTANEGPPGCWLILGNSLSDVVKNEPKLAGKGFACWSKNNSDNKQCSDDFPCVCK